MQMDKFIPSSTNAYGSLQDLLMYHLGNKAAERNASKGAGVGFIWLIQTYIFKREKNILVWKLVQMKKDIESEFRYSLWLHIFTHLLSVGSSWVTGGDCPEPSWAFSVFMAKYQICYSAMGEMTCPMKEKLCSCSEPSALSTEQIINSCSFAYSDSEKEFRYSYTHIKYSASRISTVTWRKVHVLF